MAGILRWILLAAFVHTVGSAQDGKVIPRPKARRLILTVAQLEKSVEFYRNHVGLEVVRPRYRMGDGVAELYGAPGTVMEAGVLKLSSPDSDLILIEARGRAGKAMSELRDRGAVRLLFEVSDLSATLNRLKAASVMNLLPELTGETRLALVRDPDGFFVELKQTQKAAGEERKNTTFQGLGVTVRSVDAAVRLHQEAFACDPRVGAWTATNRDRLEAGSMVGSDYRIGTCTFPRGNYRLEFLEFRQQRVAPQSRIRSLQEPGAAIVEFLVAETGYEGTLETLRSNGAEFITAGGSVTVIQGRRSVILRTPDQVFVEPRSTQR